MSTTPEEFSSWLQISKEGEHLEFKEAKTQFEFTKLLRYCVALGNEGGGKLILGVSDACPRYVVGTQAFTSPSELQKNIRNKLHIRVEVEELSFGSGRVLIFHVSGRPRGTAYQLDGAYWMRSADELVPMSEDRLRVIFNEGKPDWLLENALTDVSGDDVVRLLDTQSFFDLMKLPYPGSRDAVLERLNHERLIEISPGGWNILNLGAILFAKRLDDYPTLGRKSPRVIVYEGSGKLKTRLDKPSTKGYAVGFEGLIELINSQIPSNEVIGAALRREVKMFPEEAIRELVANALIHQDFNESGTSAVIEVYSDRLEISNPGQPFISPDRFIDEYRSRNEKLADIMRRIGICEEKGSGIDRVVSSAEAYQLPAPDFRVSELRTTAVLFAHTDFKEMNGQDRIRACYQHCCLRYVMNQRMTNQSLRSRFSLPETKMETASRIIRDTVEAGKIKPEGEGQTKKYARYIPFWA